ILALESAARVGAQLLESPPLAPRSRLQGDGPAVGVRTREAAREAGGIAVCQLPPRDRQRRYDSRVELNAIREPPGVVAVDQVHRPGGARVELGGKVA